MGLKYQKELSVLSVKLVKPVCLRFMEWTGRNRLRWQKGQCFYIYCMQVNCVKNTLLLTFFQQFKHIYTAHKKLWTTHIEAVCSKTEKIERLKFSMFKLQSVPLYPKLPCTNYCFSWTSLPVRPYSFFVFLKKNLKNEFWGLVFLWLLLSTIFFQKKCSNFLIKKKAYQMCEFYWL